MTMISDTDKEKNSLLKNEAFQVLAGVGLLFLCAQVTIPLRPVPITLQTVPVLLIGLFYSRKAAIKTMLTYLILGTLGLPLFANFSGGLQTLITVTAGYRIGFLIAVVAMTTAREQVFKQTYLTMACNSIIGIALIYMFGIAWLAFFVGISQALQVGFIPFIIPDLLKALLISFIVRTFKE
jgi:biotin transport system substrate-specific component